MSKITDIFNTMEYGPAPESDSEVRNWLKEHSQTGLFIAGEFVKPLSNSYFPTINPADETPLCSVAIAGTADVDRAVEAARSAQTSWQALSPHDRSKFLYAIARHLQKQSRFFAVLETLDNGKPIRETRDIDIPLAIRHFYHHAGWAQVLHTEFQDHFPLGVVGQIVPWNFPLLMLAWKVAPALAAGNTVVLKPAEFTSLTAIRFAELCQEVNLPAGVVNIVTGDGSVGELIVNHPEIDKIAFTGSTEVGKIIRQATAGSNKKISLELGGKSPFIVFDDADIDSAVEGIVDAIWFNQGQVCCAGSRLLVQENVAEQLHLKLRRRMESLRVGSPLDKCTDVGAIITPTQLTKIKSLVADGENEGAEVWQTSKEIPASGYYYPPTLLTNVSPASTVCQVEIFGPVLVSMTFRTPTEAVELANNTVYGLAASIWSEDINRALDVAPKLKAGVVWINSTNLFDAGSGFGGYKESGFGREGGKEGFLEYLKPSVSCESPVARQSDYCPTTDYVANIDQTSKLFIDGKQTRPDSGYSKICSFANRNSYEVGDGNRKDIRNAVEAASNAAKSWSRTTTYLRSQILYFLAENLATRRNEFIDLLGRCTGQCGADEFDWTLDRIFTYAALTDKFDGAVHSTPMKSVTLAMNEPIGVLGTICPNEYPLLSAVLGFVPAISMGNTVVMVPSDTHPLLATQLYQVIATSDIPSGVINIVTGSKRSLAQTLSEHLNVDGIWHIGDNEDSSHIKHLSAGNMKRVWTPTSNQFFDRNGDPKNHLREATQVKNIWIPYGE